MPDAPTAFEFLARDQPATVPPVCVLFGEEPLLKRESLERIRAVGSSGDDDELSLTKFDGKTVEAREVFDELATVSMFGGGRRMVVVEDADKFVTKHRERLEDYVEKPRQASVLVLSVDSWPGNTRLYKKIAASGLQINCNLPRGRWGDSVDEEPLLKWLHARAKSHHQAQLGNGAAELLMEIVGPQLGRLDQELAKLSLVAESSTSNPAGADETSKKPKSKGKASARVIERTLVEQTVGGWRAKTAWAMIEAALEGNARDAIVQLDRLLLAGEEPIALLAMMGGSLRRLAAATRILEAAELERRRMTLGDALVQAGVKSNKFVLNKTEAQLRQIGRVRAKKIFGWLLEADLALKGASSRDDRARLVLERLIVRLSRQLAAAAAKR